MPLPYKHIDYIIAAAATISITTHRERTMSVSHSIRNMYTQHVFRQIKMECERDGQNGREWERARTHSCSHRSQAFKISEALLSSINFIFLLLFVHFRYNRRRRRHINLHTENVCEHSDGGNGRTVAGTRVIFKATIIRFAIFTTNAYASTQIYINIIASYTYFNYMLNGCSRSLLLMQCRVNKATLRLRVLWRLISGLETLWKCAKDAFVFLVTFSCSLCRSLSASSVVTINRSHFAFANLIDFFH